MPGQGHAVARVGLAQHLHHQRRIGHAAGHGASGAAGVGRVDGNTPQAGLEAEDATPARRQAQRATNVGADVQRAITRRRCRTTTCAGAAGCGAQIPRVPCQRMEARQPRRQHAVVRHGGFGHQHSTGFTQAGGWGCIGSSGHQSHRSRAQRHRVALCGDVFLDGGGHTVQCAQRCAL